MVDIKKEGEKTVVTIQGDMNIYNAQDIVSSLRAVDMSSFKALEMDLSNVSEFDSSGFQIIVALKKHCEGQSIVFTIKEMSDSVKGLFNLYRVSGHFSISGGND
ncbi:MAG: STAS domain-containing protein [Thermodesulfovibrionales bacterium]